MSASKRGSKLDMNGLAIVNLGTGSAGTDAVNKTQMDTGDTNAKSRANHTGTQLAATISDFDAQVHTSTLNQMAAPTTSLSMNSQKITSLADPGTAQEAATKNYVDTAIAGLVSGQVLKGLARVAATANVTLSSPGATVDGVTMSAGDVFLATAQTTATENGPYVWNGSAVAATRATNWDTNGEAVKGSYWVIGEGTKADSLALLTNDTAITLGTSSPAFAFISVAGASIGRYETTSPAVSAGNPWTVTHNLGSRSVHWQIYRTASPYDDVDFEGERTTTNVLTLNPDIALASGEYTVVVKY